MYVNMHNSAGFRKLFNTASIAGSCSVSKSEVYERAKVMLANQPTVKPAMPSVEEAK